jgi:hypothetical protein
MLVTAQNKGCKPDIAGTARLTHTKPGKHVSTGMHQEAGLVEHCTYNDQALANYKLTPKPSRPPHPLPHQPGPPPTMPRDVRLHLPAGTQHSIETCSVGHQHFSKRAYMMSCSCQMQISAPAIVSADGCVYSTVGPFPVVVLAAEPRAAELAAPRPSALGGTT